MMEDLLCERTTLGLFCMRAYTPREARARIPEWTIGPAGHGLEFRL
jgi:hypothetical protein